MNSDSWHHLLLWSDLTFVFRKYTLIFLKLKTCIIFILDDRNDYVSLELSLKSILHCCMLSLNLWHCWCHENFILSQLCFNLTEWEVLHYWSLSHSNSRKSFALNFSGKKKISFCLVECFLFLRFYSHINSDINVCVLVKHLTISILQKIVRITMSMLWNLPHRQAHNWGKLFKFEMWYQTIVIEIRLSDSFPNFTCMAYIPNIKLLSSWKIYCFDLFFNLNLHFTARYHFHLRNWDFHTVSTVTSLVLIIVLGIELLCLYAIPWLSAESPA